MYLNNPKYGNITSCTVHPRIIYAEEKLKQRFLSFILSPPQKENGKIYCDLVTH